MTRRLFTQLKNRAMDHGISSIVDEDEFGGKDRAAKWLSKVEIDRKSKKKSKATKKLKVSK